MPGPPSIGDCVVDPLSSASDGDLSATLTVGDTVSPVYAQQQIRRCTGTRYGEVVAVVTHPQRAVVAQGSDGGAYLADPNRKTCDLRGSAYLGLDRTSTGWRPALMMTTTLSGPSPLQEGAGQRWAVCIAAPAVDTAADPTSQQYASTIRNAVHTGRQRNRLGSCLADVQSNSGFGGVSCVHPHGFEVLASGASGSSAVPRSELEQRCRQAAREVTGIADLSAAGALTTQILVQFGSSTIVTGSLIPADSAVTCGIATTGNRKLAGSLLALGHQPIPWA